MNDGPDQVNKRMSANPNVDLRLPRSIVEEMVRHALQEKPKECCGLLGGVGDTVRSQFRLINEADRPETEYHVSIGLFKPMQLMRQKGEDLLAIYHSHPTAAAVPSRRDLERNFYPAIVHFIISLLDEEPVMRGYRLHKDSFEEIGWSVIDDDGSRGQTSKGD